MFLIHFLRLAVAAPVSADELGSQLTGIVDVFTQLFQSAFGLITTNWFLLASVAVPLVAGLIFALISFFRRG